MRLTGLVARLRVARSALSCLILLAMFLVAGCVTEIEKPVTQAALFTTRVGDDVTLSWQSKAGENYAIRYAGSRSSGSLWEVLPGCERIAGTGEVIQKADKVPAGTQRYYRLIVVPAK
jgi:hypothetical protein